MTNPTNPEIKNSAYLDLILSDSPKTPAKVLLPHESAAVDIAHRQKIASFDRIISEKVDVSGGDDWHDGAFRATDNEARIITEGMESLIPFLGATVVGYPAEDEPRVTLGSRVQITQGSFSFPVDIVGFRTAYPSDVIDPQSDEEVMATSPESPLGQAILGKRVGDEASYHSGNKVLKAKISYLSQTAIQEYFMGSSNSGMEISAD